MVPQLKFRLRINLTRIDAPTPNPLALVRD
jgi:hypothetical protein